MLLMHHLMHRKHTFGVIMIVSVRKNLPEILKCTQCIFLTGGIFQETSNAVKASSATVRTYFPAANAAFGPTSSLRIINAGTSSAPLILSLTDAATGARLNSALLSPAFAAGSAQNSVRHKSRRR